MDDGYGGRIIKIKLLINYAERIKLLTHIDIYMTINRTNINKIKKHTYHPPLPESKLLHLLKQRLVMLYSSNHLM